MARDIIEELKRMHEFSPNCGICYNGKTAQEWYEEYCKLLRELEDRKAHTNE